MKLPAVLAFTVLGGAALALVPGCGPDETCPYVCAQKPRDAGAVDAAPDAGSGSGVAVNDCGGVVESPGACPADCVAVRQCFPPV